MLEMLKFIIVLSGIGLFILLILLLGLSGKKHHKNMIVRKKSRMHWKRIQLNAYSMLSKWSITRRLIVDVRDRLSMTSPIGEEVLRQRTISIITLYFFGLGVTIVLFVNLTNEPFLLFSFFIALYFMSETMIEFFVDSMRNRLIRDQIVFNDVLRLKYFENQMIDEAIEATNQQLENDRYTEMVHQGRKLFDIIENPDPEKEALKYYDTAPNKFLKLLVGIALITKEYGDRKVKGASLFMNSMTFLSNEIRIEVEKRERLNLALKSLNVIVILPLFFLKPIKLWSVSNFYPLEKFYTSSAGFALEMLMLVIILLCYASLRKVQQLDVHFHAPIRGNRVQSVYLRLKGLIQPMIPREGSLGHQAYQKIQRDTVSYERIEHFYTRKFLLGSIGLILVVSVLWMSIAVAIRQVYTAPTTDRGFMSGRLDEADRTIAMQTTQSDNAHIEQILNKQLDTQKLYERLVSDENYSEALAKRVVERIQGKLDRIMRQRLMWYHLLIAVTGFALGWQIPNFEAALRKKLISIELEHEISQFQTIITMLLHVQHLTVLDLLEWMERFSSIFKEPLQKALLNYDSGAYETLEALKRETSYHDFQKLIEKLQSACEGLSIVQAFDDFDSEKSYYQERKKRMNMELVARKINLGQLVGFMPCYSFLVIYMMAPMMWSSLSEMQIYFNTLQGL